MSAETGASQNLHEELIDSVIGDGATVRLMNDPVAYSDGQTELDNKEVDAGTYQPVSVAESDWSVSFDASDRTVTLENSTEVDFGETDSDWGTVVEVVIDADDNSDNYILSNELNDPELTGENYSFPAGEIVYTLGDGQ